MRWPWPEGGAGDDQSKQLAKHWIVGALLLKGNPYDGHTLGETREATESVTGVEVSDVYVDKGYRAGMGARGSTRVHIAGSSL